MSQTNSGPGTEILVSDHPTQNARKYRHAGCTRWFEPLGDVLPASDTHLKCEGCKRQLPLEPVDNAWSDSVSV